MFEFNENNVSQLFRPIAHCPDTNIFVNDDNTAGFSYLCTPICGWDTKTLSAIGLLLKERFPPDSMLSFSLWGSPDIKDYLLASDLMRRNCKRKEMREVHDVALGHLWGGTTNPVEINQHTMVRDIKLIITFKMPVESVDICDEEIEDILKIKQAFEQYLGNAHFNQIEMTAEMLTEIMNSMIHWGDKSAWKNKVSVGCDDYRPLNEQFVQQDTAISKEKDGVTFECNGEETYCKMLTVHRFPKKTRIGTAFQWFADPFGGDGCLTQNFLITVNLHYPEQKGIKDKVTTKHNNYIRQSLDSLSRFAPKIKIMRGELEELTKDFGQYKVVKLSLSACIFAKSKREAENGLTTLQSMMDNCGTTMIREDTFAIPSFINNLPFGACVEAANNSMRYYTMSTKHAMPMLPIFSDWKGTGTPQMQFVSRAGQIMNFDLFDSETNYNTLIYAESGSGKSFVANEITRSYLSTNDKVWTIDAGESYKKLSRAFNGNFIAFNENADISMNPFTMIDDTDPNAFNEAVTMLSGLIVAMAFSNDKVSDLQYKVIEEIIGRVWNEKGQKAKIDDVAKELKDDSDQRIRDVGRQLYSFTSQGQFGKYFDKPHNISFHGDFNVLELDGLSETLDLQAVVLYILIVQIQQAMYHEHKLDRTVKRIVIIDEAWDLLGNSPAVTEFMERGFRRFRKYNGCGIVITQSIMDLQRSAAGRAIAENAANSLILKQKDSTITAAEKDNLMSLPPAGYRLLKKVSTVKGHFSEIFFNCQDSGMGIGRFIVDPNRTLMYSTLAQDNALIDKYTNAGCSLPEALTKSCEEKRMIRYPLTRPAFLDYNLATLIKNNNVTGLFNSTQNDEKKLYEVIENDEILEQEIVL
ncbi:type IV secretion system protein TraC [Psychromonas aquimarina]|uniref:type IV secretion system protein TraC n=1 Tax=Psychromonas aquimarina TaxID=444919 RepID=UPI000415EA93|nr:type IV secretion system protein TraC [Psychromonas aquimarina]